MNKETFTFTKEEALVLVEAGICALITSGNETFEAYNAIVDNPDKDEEFVKCLQDKIDDSRNKEVLLKDLKKRIERS